MPQQKSRIVGQSLDKISKIRANAVPKTSTDNLQNRGAVYVREFMVFGNIFLDCAVW